MCIHVISTLLYIVVSSWFTLCKYVSMISYKCDLFIHLSILVKLDYSPWLFFPLPVQIRAGREKYFQGHQLYLMESTTILLMSVSNISL